MADFNNEQNEFIHEAQEQFRKGAAVLNEWGGKASDLMKSQPGAVIAGVAILGFVTGILLRRAVLSDEE